MLLFEKISIWKLFWEMKLFCIFLKMYLKCLLFSKYGAFIRKINDPVISGAYKIPFLKENEIKRQLNFFLTAKVGIFFWGGDKNCIRMSSDLKKFCIIYIF